MLIIIFPFFSCGNRTDPPEPVTADADSSAVVSVPVPLPPPEQDTTLQDSVFSNGSIPTSWMNAGIPDSAGMVRFIINFQRWVSEDLRDSIIAHVRFPLQRLKNADDFRKKYNQIFTASFKADIAKQNPRQIFRNQEGAMIADGNVWFVQEGNRFLIGGLNP